MYRTEDMAPYELYVFKGHRRLFVLESFMEGKVSARDLRLNVNDEDYMLVDAMYRDIGIFGFKLI